jgi:hypothetical protein
MTAWSQSTHDEYAGLWDLTGLLSTMEEISFFRRQILAGERIVELRGSDGRQNLSAPKRVIGLRQLLADDNGEDGGDRGG